MNAYRTKIETDEKINTYRAYVEYLPKAKMIFQIQRKQNGNRAFTHFSIEFPMFRAFIDFDLA